MAQWHVFLYGIDWDRGKEGDHEYVDLPDNLRVTVDADSREDAITEGLEGATEEFDFLINGTEQIVTKKIG